MVQGKRLRTAQPFANLQHRQIVGLSESSSVWGTRRNHRGPNQGCKEDDLEHFNGPSVDQFRSRRSPMARRIVMMKQHGRQQGCSFLPHGSKVSVQYLLVRNVNHRKRSTK